MKKATTIASMLFTLLCNENLLGQTKPSSSQGKIVYLVSLNYDSGPWIYDGELIFDQRSSLFVYDRDTHESEYDEQTQGGENKIRRVISKGRNTDKIGRVIYADVEQGKTVERDFISKRTFVVTDTLRTIDWTLLDETRDIGGMKCQKAKATVYGREYEAWFSKGIPLSYGPWKLQGLPGLILEARSTDGEINFELKEVQYPVDATPKIAPPTNGETVVGYANFHELQNRKAQETEKAFRAKLAEMQQERGTSSSVTHTVGPVRVLRIEKSPAL